MNSLGSPLAIKILLHCHCSSEEVPNFGAQAVAETVSYLLDIQAITHSGERSSNSFQTTDLGAAWVQALCDLPPPRLAYVDQGGKVIKVK